MDVVHGLLVGVVSLALALAAKIARRSWISVVWRAIAIRCFSGVTSGLRQELLSDREWVLGHDAMQLCTVLRDGGPLRDGQ